MPSLDSNEFVALLTASQRRLYAFICTLVIDRTDADEVLQETNLALWEQAERFEAGTDFVAWACRVAYYKVLKLRDVSKRHRVKPDALGWPHQVARLAERRGLDWLDVYLLVSSEVLAAAEAPDAEPGAAADGAGL
jgi:DNA-directed RNA polymerase specialized sigma24 family protein